MSDLVTLNLAEKSLPTAAQQNVNNHLVEMVKAMPEHRVMLETIAKATPELERGSSLYYKSQSQFMDNLMTFSHLTPIRNSRQMLAEITKSKEALKEAQFKLAKQDLKYRKLKRKYDKCEDDLDKEEYLIKMAEIDTQIKTSMQYISGAIRKIANAVVQYENVLDHFKIRDYTEEDFEKEEEQYHIMKAFEQGMCAARSKHDHKIDEGNFIYFQQIGISGSTAQRELDAFFEMERKAYKDIFDKNDPTKLVGREEPNHTMILVFLEQMAMKYAGSAEKLAKLKGMTTQTKVALLQKGDQRLMELEQK